MDAKELRIGNAVFVGGKIKWVNHRLISDLASDPKQLGRVKGYEITPIPLTEEWLVRMGLKYEKYNNVYRVAGNFHIRKGSAGLELFMNEYFVLNLSFVHQLQNLYFALTGEELEIGQQKTAST